jgi:hypothetical protein
LKAYVQLILLLVRTDNRDQALKYFEVLEAPFMGRSHTVCFVHCRYAPAAYTFYGTDPYPATKRTNHLETPELNTVAQCPTHVFR